MCMKNFKIENLKTMNWDNAIRGMRNPKNSWHLNDSYYTSNNQFGYGVIDENSIEFNLGENDKKLALNLISAGSSHRKFLRQIFISFDLTAGLKFFDEFATYEFVVSNSTSMMHRNMNKNELSFFTKDDFCSYNEISQVILDELNDKVLYYQECISFNKGKETIDSAWNDIIDSIPVSIKYTRTITMNYEVALNIIHLRKNHKKFEWRLLCEYLMNNLPYIQEFYNAVKGV